MAPTRIPMSWRVSSTSIYCASVLLLLTNVGWSCWMGWCEDVEGLLGRSDLAVERCVLRVGDLNRSPAFVERRRTATGMGLRVLGYQVFDGGFPYIYGGASPAPRSRINVERRAVIGGWTRRLERWPMPTSFNNEEFRGALAVGWPLPVLWYGYRQKDLEYQVDGFTAVPLNDRDWTIRSPRALPFRPILSGQIAYGLFRLAVVCIVRSGRRRWRAWRGRCPTCGYDLHLNESGVCPECGIEVAR